MNSQMVIEWEAWRQVCLQLEKLGVDINKQDPLVCAIRKWGEELVTLRDIEPKHKQPALEEAREKYDAHYIPNPTEDRPLARAAIKGRGNNGRLPVVRPYNPSEKGGGLPPTGHKR